MSENAKIEWTDHTFNPWWGCQKVGPGCDHCYAETLDKRTGGKHWGPGAERRRTSIKNWNDPIRWNAKADAFFAEHGRRQRVFCASMADVFDNAVPDTWRMDLFKLIADTPNLDWLILTKRISNVMTMCSRDSLMFDLIGERVWLGATIVNQEEADRDIPKLLNVPAHKRFLSIEPLLGPVDLDAAYLPCENAHDIVMDPETGAYECCKKCEYTGVSNEFGIDWVIVGGESGPMARPMHPDWARGLRDQCIAAKVPYLFKQWGNWREPLDGEAFDTSMGRAGKPPAFILSGNGTVHCFEGSHVQNGKVVINVGKKAAGRVLDSRTWDEVPG